MKKRIKIFLGLLMATAVSCEDTLTEIANTQDPTAVSFSASMTTRATDSAFESGDEISITAYDSDGAIYEQNVSYSYDGTLFSSDTPIKLSQEVGSLSYRAVYPYVEMSTDGAVSFTVQSDQSEGSNYTSSDLMSSYLSATSSTTPQLTFDHLLANIVVNVTSTDLEMVNVVATLNAAADVDYNMLTLTSSSAGSLTTITMASNGVNSYKAIVAPQSIAANELFGEINIDGESYKFYSSLDIDIIGGNEYVINMSVKDGTVTFEEPVINSWGNGELPYVEPTSGVLYATDTWSVDSYYSCETSEGSVDALLDGDLFTYFHSAWGIPAADSYSTNTSAPSVEVPHWFVIDLGANYTIDAVLLAPRGASASYCNSGYIETSIDKTSWTNVGDYALAVVHELQTIEVTPTIARYVKVYSTSVYLQMSGFAISGSYYGEATLFPSLTLSESNVALASTGGDFTVTAATVDTTDEVVATTAGDYITLTSVDPLTGVYTFTVSANESAVSRTGYVTFTCGELTSVVEVSQEAAIVGTTADNTTFSIHSFSTQEEVGEASGLAHYLIDGDASTYWHSVWWWSTATDSYDAAGEDHWVIVDLNAYYTINSVLLTSRNSSEQIGTIYMSNDAETWVEQAAYDNGSQASEVSVAISDTTPYRYIKLEITSTNAMMAELNITYTAVEAITVTTSDLDRTSWTVECTNTEPYEGSVANLTDGSIDTYWHSTWSTVTDHPHLISVVFDATTDISGIYMYCRQTNYNCQMYNFTIETTTDGTTWTELGTYQTATTYDRQDFSFGSTMSILGFRITTIDTQPSNADLTVVAVAELGAYVED